MFVSWDVLSSCVLDCEIKRAGGRCFEPLLAPPCGEIHETRTEGGTGGRPEKQSYSQFTGLGPLFDGGPAPLGSPQRGGAALPFGGCLIPTAQTKSFIEAFRAVLFGDARPQPAFEPKMWTEASADQLSRFSNSKVQSAVRAGAESKRTPPAPPRLIFGRTSEAMGGGRGRVIHTWECTRRVLVVGKSTFLRRFSNSSLSCSGSKLS